MATKYKKLIIHLTNPTLKKTFRVPIDSDIDGIEIKFYEGRPTDPNKFNYNLPHNGALGAWLHSKSVTVAEFMRKFNNRLLESYPNAKPVPKTYFYQWAKKTCTKKHFDIMVGLMGVPANTLKLSDPKGRLRLDENVFYRDAASTPDHVYYAMDLSDQLNLSNGIPVPKEKYLHLEVKQEDLV